MAEIVNLRLARKARARSAAQAQAATNRAVHGQTLTQKRLTRAERDRLTRTVENARREPEDC